MDSSMDLSKLWDCLPQYKKARPRNSFLFPDMHRELEFIAEYSSANAYLACFQSESDYTIRKEPEPEQEPEQEPGQAPDPDQDPEPWNDATSTLVSSGPW
jgi:hypothetical protein